MSRQSQRTRNRTKRTDIMLENNIISVLMFCLLQVTSCGDEHCKTSVTERGKPATVTFYFTIENETEAIVVINLDDGSGKTVLDCFWETSGFICYSAPGYTSEGNITNSLTMKIPSFTEEHAGRYVFQTMPPLPGDPVTCKLDLKDEKTEAAPVFDLVLPLIISVVLNAVLVPVGVVLVCRYCRYKNGTKAAALTMAFKEEAQQTDAHEDFETPQTLLKEAQPKQRQTRYWFPKWHSESRLNTVKETNLAAAITLLDQVSDAEVSLLTTEYTEMETLKDPVKVSDQTKQPIQEETPIDGRETSNYGNDHDVMSCTRSGELVVSESEKPLEMVEESDRETASPRTWREQRDQKMTQMKISFLSADPPTEHQLQYKHKPSTVTPEQHDSQSHPLRSAVKFRTNAAEESIQMSPL